MLTAEIINKIYTDTNHIPVSARKKLDTKPIGKVGPLALKRILKKITGTSGRLTVKGLVTSTGYGRATVQRAVAMLEDEKAVTVEKERKGRVVTTYVKAKKELI